MAQTIDNKLISLKVQKYLSSSQEQMLKSIDRLSSGLRVNRANDDAAGLSIAERMNTQIRGMNAGIRNAYAGISTSQIAEGGLSKVNNLLQRMRELAVQSSNGMYSDADRSHLNAEFTSLNDEISRISSSTQFNGKALLANDGEIINFQLGGETGDDNTLSLNLIEVDSLDANVSTLDDSVESISMIDSMMAVIANKRTSFSAMQGRFESAIDTLQTGMENQTAARGRIMDADFAAETASLTHAQILKQSSTAMSAQANVSAQSVMQLL